MEEKILEKLKKNFSYDLDKILKNYMKKSANEIKNVYRKEMKDDKLNEVIHFIDGVTEIMSGDIEKLINNYLNEFEKNI